MSILQWAATIMLEVGHLVDNPAASLLLNTVGPLKRIAPWYNSERVNVKDLATWCHVVFYNNIVIVKRYIYSSSLN